MGKLDITTTGDNAIEWDVWCFLSVKEMPAEAPVIPSRGFLKHEDGSIDWENLGFIFTNDIREIERIALEEDLVIPETTQALIMGSWAYRWDGGGVDYQLLWEADVLMTYLVKDPHGIVIEGRCEGNVD